MARILPKSFPLEHFTSLSDRHRDERENGLTMMEKPADAVHDSGNVKVGDSGGMPFARYAATRDTGKVKVGDGGSKPFARR